MIKLGRKVEFIRYHSFSRYAAQRKSLSYANTIMSFGTCAQSDMEEDKRVNNALWRCPKYVNGETQAVGNHNDRKILNSLLLVVVMVRYF
jgi:hypothetical protein